MSATTSKEPTPLDRAIAKYLALVDAGEPIDRERFLKEHSGVADELQAFWDASDDIEQMAGPQAGSDDGQTMLNQVKESGAHDTAESMALETQMPRRMRTEEPVSLPHEFGRYRLTRLLGEGAMGSVYLAWDSQLERDVALKMPKFDGDDRQRLIERFYTEARAAATLSHPNLCPVYDVGEFEGRHFLTMALVNGQTLSRYIGSERQQSEKHVVALVRKLALALQEAHQKGVVHRDLKPGNIMIDQRGEPIVMDFGLARRFDDAQGVQVRATKSGELIGTPAYMSPEQVEGTPEGVGPATDIYSLGVIFYELLTSRLPFTGSVGAVMGQILHKEPADVTELRPETDPRVAQICRRMMAKKAEDRFESMGEVAEWLSMVLRSQITAPAGEEKPAKQKKTKQAAAPGPVPAAGVQAFKSEDRAALAEAARACIRNHDYAQAREVLEKIPGSYRDEEVQELLKKSVELQDEVDFLIADMEQAVRLKEYKGLKTNIKRLLKLKPGYKPAKQLLEELNTYSSGEMKRRDSEGPAHYHKEEGLLRPLIIGGVFVAILFAAAWFGITFYLKTTAGTVKVTVYDPSVTVSLDKEVLTLVNDGVTTTVRMGEHTLLVERPGLNAEALTFMVEKGDDKVFRVELLEGELAIVEGAETRAVESVAGSTPTVEPPDTPDSTTRDSQSAPPLTSPAAQQGFVATERWTSSGMGIASRTEFSPNGQQVAVAFQSSGVGIFNPADGSLIRFMRKQVPMRANYAHWTPDGSELIIGDFRKSVFRISANAGRVGLADGFTYVAEDIAWMNRIGDVSPEAVFIAYDNGVIKIVNHQGELLAEFGETPADVRGADLSPDRRTFAQVGQGFLVMRDLETGTETSHAFPDRLVCSVAFTAREDRLLLGIDDSLVLWDTAGQTTIREWPIGKEAHIIRASPERTVFAFGSYQEPMTLSLVGLPDEAAESVSVQDVEAGRVSDIHWSPDGDSFAATFYPSNVFGVWDVSRVAAPSASAAGATTPGPDSVYLTELSPLDAHVAIGLSFTNVSVNGEDSPHGIVTHPRNSVPAVAFVQYDLGGIAREVVGTVAINDSATRPAASDLHFSVVGDGEVLWQSRSLRDLGDTQDFAVNVGGIHRLELRCESDSDRNAHGAWLEPRIIGDNIRSRLVPRETRVSDFSGHNAIVRSVDISDDGRLVASGGDDRSIRIWDASTGETTQVLAGHTATAWTVRFDPAANVLASGGNDNALRLWDVQTGEQLAALTDHTGPVRRLDFSPDGSLLVSCAREIIIWDMETRRPLQRFDGDNMQIHAVAFSPDASLVAFVGDDRRVHVQNVNTAQESATLELDDVGSCIDYSPDGKSIICGTVAGNVVIWDPDTNQAHEIQQADSINVTAVAAIPGSKRFVTTGQSGMVKIWDLETRALIDHWYAGSHEFEVACTDEPAIVVGGAHLPQVRLWRPEQ